MQAFGPKENVLGQVLQRVAPPPPIKIVPEAGAAKIMTAERRVRTARSGRI